MHYSIIGSGRGLTIATILIAVCGLATFAYGAEEPDLIFKRSTVFKWLTPNDKLATYGIDDPEVDGVACHFTVPERGGLQGLARRRRGGLRHLACLPADRPDPVQAEIRARRGSYSARAARSSSRRCRSFAAATSSAMCSSTWSIRDKLIEGSPKNSTSSVPIMPWGGDPVVRCADWIEK